MLSTLLQNFLSFSSNLKLSSANPFSLEEFKICCLEQLPISVCFENDSPLTLHYFLLISYAAIFNSLLTVPQPFWCQKRNQWLCPFSAYIWFYEYENSLFFQRNNSWSIIILITFIKRITKHNFEKKKKKSRYSCDLSRFEHCQGMNVITTIHSI